MNDIFKLFASPGYLVERIFNALTWRVNVFLSKYRKRKNRFLRNFVSLDNSKIKYALEKFGDLKSEILLVHSSLSACGKIDRGAEAVIEALQEWAVQRTLVMPTHTYCYPDQKGDAPIFDPLNTPSKVGEISEKFRKMPGVIRSIHPTHSIACKGPLAAELCEGHELCSTPCGKETPYEKILKRATSVLMFGVTFSSYTLFHTAENEAGAPYLYESEPYELRFRNQQGNVKELITWRHNMHIMRRFSQMDIWFEKWGLLKRCRLGIGELLFIENVGQAHEKILKELRKDPFFLIYKKFLKI